MPYQPTTYIEPDLDMIYKKKPFFHHPQIHQPFQTGPDHCNQYGPGIFGADIKIRLLNDGPKAILIDIKNKE